MLGQIFLGKFETVRLLGQGRMGQVYLAKDRELSRPVVVKLVHKHLLQEAGFAERFKKEMLVTARFQHPYAVAVYDCSLDDPAGPCVIMEFVRGVTLDVLRRNNKDQFSASRIDRLLHQLCECLEAAHSEGLIHCDLKPSNLMVLDGDTPYEKIKVTDFGLARVFLPGNTAVQEKDAASAGYMSPERVQDQPLDRRADIYSLGALLFEMLTGRLPFMARTRREMLQQHVTGQPPSLEEIGAAERVPAAVGQVVLACLSKDPSQRPGSARELYDRFNAAVLQGYEQPPAEPAAEAQPQPEQQVIDPNGVVYHVEACMPLAIAERKLFSFAQDAGGTVVESIPGLIRVQLGGRGTRYQVKSGALSWLGLRRRTGLIELHFRIFQTGNSKANQLTITVLMRSLDGELPDNTAWRVRCNRIYTDLRSYLIGQDAAPR